MRKKYLKLAIVNFILGVCAICLYLPYTLEAFDMAGFEWFKFVPNMLKDNYYNVLIYFGVLLILWFILLNLIGILHHINLPKFLFKMSIIVALILPLMYVLALDNNFAFNFWIKNILPNIKTISYIFLGISCGTFVLGLIYNITRKNHANSHHIIEATVMCLLLVLMCIVNGWCGWNIDVTIKLYGIMIGLFALYLPISGVNLLFCKNKRY